MVAVAVARAGGHGGSRRWGRRLRRRWRWLTAGGDGGSRRWWRREAMATTGRQLLASPPLPSLSLSQI
uniref:Uncharacterized protein n=1 Tax=Oryza glumipatula TaxID=40148 RepID=A0A0E0B8I2_9ORYZ